MCIDGFYNSIISIYLSGELLASKELSDTRQSSEKNTTPLPWLWVVVVAVGLVIIMALSGVIYVVCKTHPFLFGSSRNGDTLNSRQALQVNRMLTRRPLVMNSETYQQARPNSGSIQHHPYRPFLTFYQANDSHQNTFMGSPGH